MYRRTMDARKSEELKVRTIGIALAVYNPDRDQLSEQLRSIRDQTWQSWRCVLTCDSELAELGRSPNLEEYFSDQRFVWVQNTTRLGHKRNFEAAIRRCAELNVDAICCSDQDDIWYPNKLERCAAALERAGALSLVHSDLDIAKNGEIQPISAWTTEQRNVYLVAPEHLLVRNVVTGCTMMMDAQLAKLCPEIPPSVQYHDHWYALIASLLGGVHAVPERLMAYRQHGENVVGVRRVPGAFARVFTNQGFIGLNALLERCESAWHQSEALARDVSTCGLPMPSYVRNAFLAKADFGLLLLLQSAKLVLADRVLATGTLVRAVGKSVASAKRIAERVK